MTSSSLVLAFYLCKFLSSFRYLKKYDLIGFCLAEDQINHLNTKLVLILGDNASHSTHPVH